MNWYIVLTNAVGQTECLYFVTREEARDWKRGFASWEGITTISGIRRVGE